MEVMTASLEREREGDEFELSLELSIGGCYGKSMNTRRMMEVENRDPFEENYKKNSRSDFSCKINKRDLEKERETIVPQALMKQESCMEREDELVLDVQQFQAGVEDRENREKNGISEHGRGEIVRDFNGDFKSQQMQKGDTGETNSSSSNTRHKVKRLKVDSSEPRTHQEQSQSRCTILTGEFERTTSDDRTSCCARKTGCPVRKPPKPPNHKIEGVPVRQMPCVTTTGNGPHGKTITGFLYKYTKSEVTIVCVCHGSSFSPAEFVEHAGGVDISNPLRHITVVNLAR